MSLKEEIDIRKLPKHIAIIMDGNGRWAEKNGQDRLSGHEHGSRVVKQTITCAKNLGIKVLTLYAFSTENWNRPKKEVFGLMKLLGRYLSEEKDFLIQEKIRLNVIGNWKKLPSSLVHKIEEVQDATLRNENMLLNIALSYGGREEIIKAVNKILEEKKKKITESSFQGYLYTSGIPDPDLLIRSSGEMRISNFLLWQSAYTEFYFTDVLWPDFKDEDFYGAIQAFQNRKRRYGTIRNS